MYHIPYVCTQEQHRYIHTFVGDNKPLALFKKRNQGSIINVGRSELLHSVHCSLSCSPTISKTKESKEQTDLPTPCLSTTANKPNVLWWRICPPTIPMRFQSCLRPLDRSSWRKSVDAFGRLWNTYRKISRRIWRPPQHQSKSSCSPPSLRVHGVTLP